MSFELIGTTEICVDRKITSINWKLNINAYRYLAISFSKGISKKIDLKWNKRRRECFCLLEADVSQRPFVLSIEKGYKKIKKNTKKNKLYANKDYLIPIAKLKHKKEKSRSFKKYSKNV